MTDSLYTDDPEPSDRLPAGLLYVPVRPGPYGFAARMFRTPLGDRTAVGFTSHRRMTAVLGREQACTRLSVPALRALAEPLGVTALTVDPQLAAPPVRHEAGAAPAPVPGTAPAPAAVPVAAGPGSLPKPSARTGWDPQMVGVMRVTAMAAAVEALTLWIG
ncbi:hypothetical protein SAMN05216267_10489 [Actinacidiphila rubida]|uniref:Uncharacterized protein n=1 Tax=Actinacidiphila rubida TaxID=310780 RepID=A0A1H8T5V8_9ACTN|nr:SAV_915 family protein [Actinacidiphila rubida]SEO85918.1 hypothetical protein SAMN05216267_10489 [Actinacidiphila rubida]